VSVKVKDIFSGPLLTCILLLILPEYLTPPRFLVGFVLVLTLPEYLTPPRFLVGFVLLLTLPEYLTPPRFLFFRKHTVLIIITM
jgi:hypothetical protein